MPLTNDERRARYGRLAGSLYVTFMAQRTGYTVAYAHRRYRIDPRDLTDFWFAIAEDFDRRTRKLSIFTKDDRKKGSKV